MRTAHAFALGALIMASPAFAGQLTAPLKAFPIDAAVNTKVQVSSPELTLTPDENLADLTGVDSAFDFAFQGDDQLSANLIVSTEAASGFEPFRMWFRVPFSQESVSVAAAAVSTTIHGGSKRLLIKAARTMPTQIGDLVVLNQRARLLFRDLKSELDGGDRNNPNPDDVAVAFIFVRTATSLGQSQFLVPDSETRAAADFLEQQGPKVSGLDVATKANIPDLIAQFRNLENNFKQALVDATVSLINKDPARGCAKSKQLTDEIGIDASNQSLQNVSNYATCIAMQKATEEAAELQWKLNKAQEQAEKEAEAAALEAARVQADNAAQKYWQDAQLAADRISDRVDSIVRILDF